MSVKTIVGRALEQGRGILRLAPNWIPRSFCVPGRRIKLLPDDYYAMGGERGGIDERWFASTTPADDGPLTSPNKKFGRVVSEDNNKPERMLSCDVIQGLGDEVIGDRTWDRRRRPPIYSKSFEIDDSSTQMTWRERLKRWLFPHLREGKHLAEAYTRARVAREEGEARKAAEEAMRIAVRADLEKQEDLKKFVAAVDEIFQHPGAVPEATLLKLAKLIENNPGVPAQVGKAQLLLRSLASTERSGLISGQCT